MFVTVTDPSDTSPIMPCAFSTPIKAAAQDKKRVISPGKSEPAKKRPNLNSDECSKRQEHLQAILQERFIESPGNVVSQEKVMNALETENKNLATRAVKGAFRLSKLIDISMSTIMFEARQLASIPYDDDIDGCDDVHHKGSSDDENMGDDCDDHEVVDGNCGEAGHSTGSRYETTVKTIQRRFRREDILLTHVKSDLRQLLSD